MGPKKKTNLFYGKAKSYLVCNFPIPAHLNMGCRNGHVLHILATNNDSYQVTVELISKYFNINIFPNQILQLVKKSKVFVKGFSRNSKQFIDICNMLFEYQPTTSAVTQTSQLITTSNHIATCSSFFSQQIAVSSLSNSDSSQESLSRLRADLVSPRKKIMRKRLTILENEIAIKKRKHKEDLKGLREKAKARPYRLKYLNQVIACKEKIIHQLRKKLKEHFLNIQLKKLQNQIFYLKLSSKLRACKNKTTALLCKKPTDIQNKLILWAISNARKNRFTSMQCHNELKLELLKRIVDKIQKREDKDRRKVEKILKSCMPDQVKEMFPDLENNEASDIEEILIGAAIGRSICHMRFDNANNTHEVYYGRIVCIKKKNNDIYI
ncbi:uncharacterized protein LOC124810638 [Hydra vulgaris]|uniref:uncharacterized protein LOC124810638 n=1 Tax=Hydra vulgaris TaxID=6087 RepID=UPI0032EA2CA3